MMYGLVGGFSLRLSEDQLRDAHGRWASAVADAADDKEIEAPFSKGIDIAVSKPQPGIHTIALKDLYVSGVVQHTVYAGTVRKYVDKPPKGAIKVVKYKGKYMIKDGHHRAAAALLRGDSAIQAKVSHSRTPEAD